MYTLTNSKQIPLSCIRDKSIYVIYFQNEKLARHLHYNVNPVNVNARLSHPEKSVDITKQINDLLSTNDKNVYLNLGCVLKIDKRNEKQRTFQNSLTDELMYMLNLEKVDMHTCVKNILEKKQRMILPFDVLHENKNYIEYICNTLYSKSENETLDSLRNDLQNMYNI